MEEAKNPFLEKSVQVLKDTYRDSDQIFDEEYIFIPPNNLLDEIYAKLGVKSFEELFPSMIDFENYFWTISYSGQKEMVLEQFAEEENLNILSEETLRLDNVELTVFYIEGFVLNDQIADEIERRIIMTGAKGDEYIKMPKDVFRNIILAGDVTGKDLVHLCSTNKIISEKCDADDYLIFRKLLERDFKLKRYKRNPKELYLLMHKIGNFLRRFRRDSVPVVEENSGEIVFLENYSELQLFVENTPWQLLYSVFGYGELHIEGFFASKIGNNQKVRNLTMIFHKLLLQASYHDDDYHNDLEDIWFEKIRPERESEYTQKELNEIDNMWDDAPTILAKSLKGVNIRKTIKNYYDEVINRSLNHFLDQHGYSGLQTPEKFELSEKDLDYLVAIHELVMDGTISISYPLTRWEHTT